MGTPIPVPPMPSPGPPGESCDVCWGPGKPFGDFPTPSEVTITVTGVEKGPNWVGGDGEPPNGVFICTQFFPAFPCIYFSGGTPNLGCGFSDANTSVLGQTESGENWFNGLNLSPCVTIVENQENDHFKSGTAVITIPEVG